MTNHASPQSAGQPRLSPTIQHVWLTLPLVISFIVLNLTPLIEGDLWWQLKVGEQILQTKQFSLFDKFSFTAAGEAFYYTYYWLSSVLLHLIERAGGISALVLTQALISTCIVWLMLRETRKRDVPVMLAVMVTVASFLGLYPYSSTRTQIFSFLFFAIFYTIFNDYIRRNVNRLWLLPILMVLWVNIHGAWVTGVILWLVILAARITQRWWKSDSTIPVLPLLGWGLVMIVVLPINPNGFSVYQNFLLTLGRSGVVTQYVSEWQPLLITNFISWAFYGLFFLWIVGLALTPKYIALYDLLLMLVFALLALRYMRMAPFFYILAVPIVTESLSRLDWAQVKDKLAAILERWNKPLRKDVPGNHIRIRNLNIAFLSIFLLGAILSLPPIHIALRNTTPDSLISRYFPVDALAELSEQSSRVYSLVEWGGYLTWKLYPPTTIFVDGRIPMYPMSIWDDYLTIALAEPGWEMLLDRYAIDTLVLSKERHGAIIVAARQAGWRDMAEDNASVVLMKPVELPSYQP